MKRFVISIAVVLTCISASAQINATAQEIAQAMAPGWNLGNTMEAGNNANNWKNVGLSTETAWQGTKTTQAIIDKVRDAGFKSVRIPTAWIMGHIINSDNVTIDPNWLARVKEIVDYCINDGLYVLLNDHWDGGWLEYDGFTNQTDVEAKKEQLRKLWTNIANYFIDYDEHLLFAGLNEPGVGGASPAAKGTKLGNAQLTARLLEYEQVFIDAVRATGGNNATRTLVVQGPNTNIDNSTDASVGFNMSKLNDPAGEGRLMVEIHDYDPYQFCGMDKDADWGKVFYYWGNGNHVSGSSHNATWAEESYMAQQMNKLKTKFVDNGYPVIIGEFGANWRTITGTGESQAKHNASIRTWYATITQYAMQRGMVPMAWDTNYTGHPSMTIINRGNRTIFNQYALDGITEGATTAGIEEVKTENTGNADMTIYSISGIPEGTDSSSLPKGIHIRNKTKFVVRR